MDFSIIPKEALDIVNILEDYGHETYFVGGCVRDVLRDAVPHDWDITTAASPEEMKTCFAQFRTLETGLKHGTLSIINGGKIFEVTTYRVDGEYEDNRRPSEVFFTRNLTDDLARRDFTVNAMAYSPVRGLVDIFGGREDIKRKSIRCVGDSDKRFNEDGLRILRALRFASVLDFYIDSDTELSVHKNKGLLSNISAERIRDEFFKLVMGIGAERVLLNFPDVICEFIPELRSSVGFDQKNQFHAYDVYTHSIKAMTASNSDLYVKLALFFHDIGKPSCFSEDESGGHFYGHQEISAELTEAIMRRLHAGNEMTAIVTRLVKDHHKIIQNDAKGIRRLLASLGEVNAKRLIEMRRGDNSALIPGLKEPRLAELAETERLLQEELKKECCLSLRTLVINGDDLIKLGMKPGRDIGKLLAGLLDNVIEGNLPNEREILLDEAKKRIIHDK